MKKLKIQIMYNIILLIFTSVCIPVSMKIIDLIFSKVKDDRKRDVAIILFETFLIAITSAFGKMTAERFMGKHPEAFSECAKKTARFFWQSQRI